MDTSAQIRNALLQAHQEIANRKRSLPAIYSPASSSSSSHSSSAHSSNAAHKKHKPSHTSSSSRPSSSSSSSPSTAQSIKDAIAASRSELESKRRQHPSTSSPSSAPPSKPLSPYDRFIRDHWDDDEYDGLSDHERQEALNKRFMAVSHIKKEAWTSDWQRDMEAWDESMRQWQEQSGKAVADNGRSTGSSHKPAAAPRSTKSSSSSSTAAPSPTASSFSASLSSSSPHSTAPVNFSALVSQHYSQQNGQLSLVPHVNKSSRNFLTLTFPLPKITSILSLLPQPPTPSTTKLFPTLTVATISRAVEYFIQHISALVLAAAVAGGSKVLRPEDYRAVIMRRPELWWLRWAQEDDRDVRGRYRTGQLAAVEKKRRDAEDRARGRKLQDDGESGDGGGQDELYGSDEDERRMEEGEQPGYSRMDDDEDGEDDDDNDDSNPELSAGQQNEQSGSTADIHSSLPAINPSVLHAQMSM